MPIEDAARSVVVRRTLERAPQGQRGGKGLRRIRRVELETELPTDPECTFTLRSGVPVAPPELGGVELELGFEVGAGARRVEADE